MFSFSLPLGGQVAISILVYAVLNLIAGLIDGFAPRGGSKISNYVFRFAVGGFVGTFIGLHFITNGSDKGMSIPIDIISGFWGAIMFLWIFKVDEKKRNLMVAVFSAIVFTRANVYSLFWGFGKWTLLTVFITVFSIIAALYLSKVASDKGQYTAGLLNGIMAIASGSAYILKSDIKGLMIALLITLTALTFHANVLKNDESKKILSSVFDKKNAEKVKDIFIKAKELV